VITPMWDVILFSIVGADGRTCASYSYLDDRCVSCYTTPALFDQLYESHMGSQDINSSRLRSSCADTPLIFLLLYLEFSKVNGGWSI
jgi:hypothetical protein